MVDEAYSRELIVRPVRNCIVLSPPLIMQEEHIADIGRILREAIDAAAGV